MVKLGCDLCDLDLWPFAWTLLWSWVITPENFMMIRWWEHSQKGVTDRRTDGQTENTICRAAWSQLKTIGHLFYATSSFMHHFLAICEFKLELRSGNAPIRIKIGNFLSRVTLKVDGWPWNTIGHFSYATSSFVHHPMWIQTGVRVRKWLNWIFTSVTLIFELWTWPFTWISLLSIVITPDNFMMIWWLEHSEKGVTDRKKDKTDGGTESFMELLGSS